MRVEMYRIIHSLFIAKNFFAAWELHNNGSLFTGLEYVHYSYVKEKRATYVWRFFRARFIQMNDSRSLVSGVYVDEACHILSDCISSIPIHNLDFNGPKSK